MSVALGRHFVDASGNGSGGVDPSKEIVLLPEPPSMDLVRVPIWLAIQADGPRDFIMGQAHDGKEITVHGMVRRAIDAQGAMKPLHNLWGVTPASDPAMPYSYPYTLLWSLKLTPDVTLNGEYFIPVAGIPIVAGTELVASWSYQSGACAIRTRAIYVDVPIADFDWSRVPWPLANQPRHTTA